MSEQQDSNQEAQLDSVSDDLERALKACHNIIDDYRHKLAAQAHDLAANDGELDARIEDADGGSAS
jgi:hypothetical protein